MKEFEFEIEYNEKPESYARERKGKFAFYNPKSGKMKTFREYCKNVLSSRKSELDLILSSPNYFVEFDMGFYFKVPKGDSKKVREQKLNGEILPAIRPDIDNFVKFIMDSMHEVFYDDDKRVTKISAFKAYGEKEKTVLKVKIKIV